MVLVWEIQQPTRNSAFLKHVEDRQSFRHWKAEIQVTMNDEVRSTELEDVLWCRRIIATIVVSIVPDGAVELGPIS